jgi:hypothetical protein
VADWWQHRRADIEHPTGTRKSLLHALMMVEVGVLVALALLCEVNRLVPTDHRPSGGRSPPGYGSGGWGFESLAARSIAPGQQAYLY